MYFWILLFLSVFCKFAVPLFFMISGVLYLKRDFVDTKYILIKLFKLIVVFFIAYNLRAFVYLIDRNRFFFFLELKYIVFFKMLYINALYYESILSGDFWFMFLYSMYIVILKMIIIKQKEKYSKAVVWIFAIFVFLSFYPFFKYLFSGSDFIQEYIKYIWIIFIIIACPVSGYFIENKLFDCFNKHTFLFWFINISLISFSVFFTFYKGYKLNGVWTEDDNQDFHGSFSFFNAAVIYMMFKKYFSNISEKKQALFAFLSKSVFFVYLLHINVMLLLPEISSLINGYASQSLFFPSVFLLTGYILLIFICCVLLWFVMSKIPVVKRLTRF